MLTPTVQVDKLSAYWGHDDNCACLQIRALVSGLPEAQRKNRVLVMVQVVVDDSNRGQEDAPAFILAGWMATVNNWATFTERWQAELDSEPAIHRIKASEAINLKKNFAGYSDRERDERLLKFVTLINDCAFASVRLSLKKRDFDALLKARGALAKMYATPTASIVSRVIHFAVDRGMRQTFEFIFDEGIMTAKQLEDMYRGALADLPAKAARMVKKFRHDTDDNFYPLQAADLFAGYVREDLIAKAEDREFESPVWTALQKKPCLVADLDARRLTYMRLAISRLLGLDPF